MLDYKKYITASGAYPDRLNSKELTKEYKDNAEKVVKAVNLLLKELGVDPDVSSGFRPLAINSATKGAAKASNHTKCLAVDLMDDKDQKLAKAILKTNNLDDPKTYDLSLLKKYGLTMESPIHTRGKNTNWVHLQVVSVKSGNLVFVP